mmetsp:Transcript_9289/g.15918  ORF Transcript_9289/g.15918 Transcript_9289/m.15918 type:complete len:210 (+) Transcript_9289:350-979(+)
MALTHLCISLLQKASLSADSLNSLNFSKVLGISISISSLMFSSPKALAYALDLEMGNSLPSILRRRGSPTDSIIKPSLEEMRADDTRLSAQRYLTCFTKNFASKLVGKCRFSLPVVTSMMLETCGSSIPRLVAATTSKPRRTGFWVFSVTFSKTSVTTRSWVFPQSTLMPSRSHGSFQMLWRSSLWMARCTSSWETSRKKGFSASHRTC